MICNNLNISSLIVELDVKAIVDVSENTEYVNNVISPILGDCRLLVTRFDGFNLNTATGRPISVQTALQGWESATT